MKPSEPAVQGLREEGSSCNQRVAFKLVDFDEEAPNTQSCAKFLLSWQLFHSPNHQPKQFPKVSDLAPSLAMAYPKKEPWLPTSDDFPPPGALAEGVPASLVRGRRVDGACVISG